MITSLHTLAGAAVLAGVIAIVAAITAQQRATRAVRECKDLVQGSIGSRGTADPRALRDVGLVRYDALQEMSGQMSFSLALLNAAGDGVVVSSINGRAETRTYAKTVKASEGTQELSPEEEAAIRSAKMGLGFDQPVSPEDAEGTAAAGGTGGRPPGDMSDSLAR